MKSHSKLLDPNMLHKGLFFVVVLGVAIFGAYSIIFSKAATGYSNPYSCPSRPMLSTSTGSSQPTCTKYVQYVVGGITVDGNFGPNTKTAVQKFQFNYKVTNSGCGSTYSSCDGIVGSSTWTKLDQVNASKTQAAAPQPTGSLTCASTTSTTRSIRISYSNATTSNKVNYYRNGALVTGYSNGTATITQNETGQAPSTNITYQLRSSANNTTLASIGCATKAAPTGTLTCGSVTASSVALNVKYANSDGATSLLRGTTILVNYPTGSATTTRTDSGLAANTTYAYSLKSGTKVIAGVSCKTAAAAAPSTSSGTTAPTSPTTAAVEAEEDVVEEEQLEPGEEVYYDEESALDYSDEEIEAESEDESGVDIASSGEESEIDGLSTDSSDENGDGNNAVAYSDENSTNTGDGSTRLDASKTSTIKTVVSALGVVALMVATFFGWLFIRGRRLNQQQNYDYNRVDYTAFDPSLPQAVTGSDAPQIDSYASATIPLPPQPTMPAPSPVPAPVATNQMENIINSAFYPGQAQPSAGGNQASKNEPLDMYEVATQYPTSFGNSHVVSPLTPTAQQLTAVSLPPQPALPPQPILPPAPVVVAPVVGIDDPGPMLQPITPNVPPVVSELEPVASADGTLELHPRTVTPTPTSSAPASPDDPIIIRPTQ